MLHQEPTNAERAVEGDRVTAVFIGHAVEAGAKLTRADRAELGRRMVEEYSGGPLAEGDVATALGEMIADLYHHADGTVSPGAMLGAALMELSATVNTLPVLCALGEEGLHQLRVHVQVAQREVQHLLAEFSQLGMA